MYQQNKKNRRAKRNRRTKTQNTEKYYMVIQKAHSASSCEFVGAMSDRAMVWVANIMGEMS